METFTPVSDFYKAINGDPKICATHISLYFALLYHWNMGECNNPFIIVRDELMKTAKINARHTYNKCMNELDEYGYINYAPSSNPFSGSTVKLKFMDPQTKNENNGK